MYSVFSAVLESMRHTLLRCLAVTPVGLEAVVAPILEIKTSKLTSKSSSNSGSQSVMVASLSVSVSSSRAAGGMISQFET